jgi:hypothetical protein
MAYQRIIHFDLVLVLGNTSKSVIVDLRWRAGIGIRREMEVDKADGTCEDEFVFEFGRRLNVGGLLVRSTVGRVLRV